VGGSERPRSPSVGDPSPATARSADACRAPTAARLLRGEASRGKRRGLGSAPWIARARECRRLGRRSARRANGRETGVGIRREWPAGATATREFTDTWLTLQTKLALFADERVSSGDVHVTTQRGVITLRGKVDNEAEQQAAGEIARTIESPREVVAEPGEGPPAILKRQRQRYDERRGVPTLAVHCYRKRR